MLRNHLDPNNPLASRPTGFIERSVRWAQAVLELGEGSRILDLGCGPGLYAHRLARAGVKVVGMDVSSRSIAYAREVAKAEGLSVVFREGDYLKDAFGDTYDAAMLIYEDYCALSPQQRALLLRKIREALRPGGRFLFDIAGLDMLAGFSEGIVHEENLMGGFWAEPPYSGTHETWLYHDEQLVLERYTIRTESSERQFWNWMQCLTPGQVEDELVAAGLSVAQIYGDVAGSAYQGRGASFAVLSTKDESYAGRFGPHEDSTGLGCRAPETRRQRQPHPLLCSAAGAQ